MEVESSIFNGCDLGFTKNSLCIHASSKAVAIALLKKNLHLIASQAKRFKLREASISYPDCEQPFTIPVGMAKSTAVAVPEMMGDDYLKVWALIQAEKESGKIVIITSNVTRDRQGSPIDTSNPIKGRDFCYNTLDTLLPSRGTWTSDRWTGYNYRLSWRLGRDNFRELNPEYDQLKDLLARDGFIPNYHYRLYRPPADDETTGAFCEYNTTYYRVRLPWYNDEVRIGISDPHEWRVIEEGRRKERAIAC